MIIDICGYDARSHSGGPAAWIQRFPLLMRKRGHDVRIRLFAWDMPEEGSACKHLRAAGFDVGTVAMRMTKENIEWLVGAAAEAPPDAVIANNVIPACLAAPWFRAAGIPVIGILRSDDEFYRAVVDRFIAEG